MTARSQKPSFYEPQVGELTAAGFGLGLIFGVTLLDSYWLA
jgi:hypothetical protein